MTQGERVRSVRKAVDLTMEKFGARLGVTKTAISLIESDKNNLTDSNMRAICREFRVNYDYLVHGEGEMFDSLPGTVLDELCLQYGCDDEDRVIIEEYLKLDPDSRSVLKDYIRKIKAGIS